MIVLLFWEAVLSLFGGGGGGCLFVVIVAVLDCCVVAVLVNLLLYFCEVVYLLSWRDVLFFVLIPSGSL